MDIVHFTLYIILSLFFRRKNAQSLNFTCTVTPDFKYNFILSYLNLINLSYLILSYLILNFILNLISSHLISSHLISSHLISSHLISSHLISSHLISSHLISSHLISSHLILSYLIFSFRIGWTRDCAGNRRTTETWRTSYSPPAVSGFPNWPSWTGTATAPRPASSFPFCVPFVFHGDWVVAVIHPLSWRVPLVLQSDLVIRPDVLKCPRRLAGRSSSLPTSTTSARWSTTREPSTGSREACSPPRATSRSDTSPSTSKHASCRRVLLSGNPKP